MKNETGEILADTYPRWKLKEIKDDRYTTITEKDIIGIMNYKKTNNKTLYKIIFKDNSKKWIDKSIIDEKLLNDYHKKLDRKNSVFKKFNILQTIMMTLFLLISICTSTQSKIIRENFKICATVNLKTIKNPHT